jgi:hypothetical protein
MNDKPASESPEVVTSKGIDSDRILTRENTAAREALALAHAILAKMQPSDVAHAVKRAAIKHEGNDPMGYIAGVLANDQGEARAAQNTNNEKSN